MNSPLPADVAAIQAIGAVPTILEAAAAITGLRFVCVASVTPDSFTVCAVRDQLGFNLAPGGTLDVRTTLCDTVRDTGKAVIIDHVAEDPRYRDHHTPRIYGFQSYISVPILRQNGDYFGTLCGLDPLPADLSNTKTIASMTLFAQLISIQLATENSLAVATAALSDERETAELREQFIAVLGHDVRTPLGSIVSGAELLLLMPEIGPRATAVAGRMQRSAQRINGLVNDVLDFTRGRMGGGIDLTMRYEAGLGAVLEQVVAELRGSHSSRQIGADIRLRQPLLCDAGRIAQLLSNLLNNALVHGDPVLPVSVRADDHGGQFTLAVRNGGAPIPAATIAQLFKPYWRSPGRATSEGLGLGLFIVAEIARSHGGDIEVVSTDEHTTFVFTMPAVSDAAPASARAGSAT